MEQDSISHRKWFYFTVPAVLLGLFYLAGWIASGFSLITLIKDIVLFVVALLFWLAFFAQFTLPVRGAYQRFQIFLRLILYVTKSHGPAIFVRNGKVVENPLDEKKKREPGVIWLDTASAAVLRKDTQFTRTVGPGVVFTEKGEYIAGCVDLHKQTQSIGPQPTDNLFIDPKDANPDEYKAAQDRRKRTSELTREGLEVIPTINVTFSIAAEKKPIKPLADPSYNTQFGYNEEAVTQAIRGQSVNLDASPESPQRQLAWNELPVYLAANVWREYIRKFTFSQLFLVESGENGLELITRMMNERLKSKEVDELDDVGMLTGKKMPSLEFKLLSERGLKVMSVGISNLFFENKLEEAIILNWSASWLKHARVERDEIDRLSKLNETRGYEDALIEFAETASHFLGEDTTPPEPHTALYKLMQGANYSTVRNNKIRRLMNTEARDIQDIMKWAQDRQ